MPRIEYDFHGMRADMAAARLQGIIARHAPQGSVVHIIHGKGTGRLAEEVMRVARSDPRVADAYRSGVNAGVTILQLQPGTPPTGSPGAALPRVRKHTRR